MSAIYFGGSRNLKNHPFIYPVVRKVLCSGTSVHVGCQSGADEKVMLHASVINPSSLFVFAVASKQGAPCWVGNAQTLGASVRYQAGGESAPIKARYLLRSIAAFQGCSAAVFFQPGAGSLAVAREFAKTGKPIFAFSEQAPAAIPNTSGAWFQSEFQGFECWLWSYNQMSFI